ncbi:TPA: prophage tail fiber N-terminal domain-containing protein, partial [Escherichia coli]
MVAVKISGVLKDGAGKPIQNCTIQLKAKRNSTTVLVNTVASENPDEAGRYSMDVEYGQYSVTLLVEGFPPSHAGTITVYEGSRPGTLNDFLGAMTEDDVMPEALRRFEEMVEEAARNAEAASQSAAAAKKSETASAASQTAAKASEDAAREYASQAAEPYKYVLQPLPDVWIPFNDSLDMITGFSPSYKKIVIGDDEITMPGDKIVKFKRASTATYINKSGQLKLAEVDEPRFERDGLLIEGQRTN